MGKVWPVWLPSQPLEPGSIWPSVQPYRGPTRNTRLVFLLEPGSDWLSWVSLTVRCSSFSPAIAPLLAAMLLLLPRRRSSFSPTDVPPPPPLALLLLLPSMLLLPPPPSPRRRVRHCRPRPRQRCVPCRPRPPLWCGPYLAPPEPDMVPPAKWCAMVPPVKSPDMKTDRDPWPRRPTGPLWPTSLEKPATGSTSRHRWWW